MSTLKTLLILATGYVVVKVVGSKHPSVTVDNPTNINVINPDITYYRGYSIKTFTTGNTFGFTIFQNGNLIKQSKGGVYETVSYAILQAELYIDSL